MFAHFEPTEELKWALKECPAEYFVHVPEDFEVDFEKLEMILTGSNLFDNGTVWCQTLQNRAPVKREGIFIH